MPVTKIARVGLLLVLLAGFGATRASATPIVSIDTREVHAGQMFSLDVRISDVTDLFAFQFDLAFDPAVLSVLDVKEGSFLSGGGFTFFVPGAIDNTAGTVVGTANTLLGAVAGVDGTGPLATIDFLALERGVSPLTLSNVLLLDSALGDVATSTSDGFVVVPEPGAWLLLLVTGCAGLLGSRGRHRSRAASRG